MSYIIKKHKFLKNLDKIKETCLYNEYDMPTLLKDYPLKDLTAELKIEYDWELDNFLKVFPEFSDIAIDLNENQKEIVTYGGNKFLSIEAGPGAGKTRVLIEKVNYMVNELGGGS